MLIWQEDFSVELKSLAILGDDAAAVRSLFSYIHNTGERSKRVFRLTERVITADETDYTAWQVRRDCAANTTWLNDDELDLVHAWALKDPKSYQVWNHLTYVTKSMSERGELDDIAHRAELAFLEESLEAEPKNLCTWQYRQFYVGMYPALAPTELPWVSSVIAQDPFDNSAWNYRHWLCEQFGVQDLKTQWTWAMKHFAEHPACESAFHYLLSVGQMLRRDPTWDPSWDSSGVWRGEERTETQFTLMLRLLLDNKADKATKSELQKQLQTTDPLRAPYYENMLMQTLQPKQTQL